MSIRPVLLVLSAMCIAATAPQLQSITFSSSGKTLSDGAYYRSEWVDRKSATYSINQVWDNPPIFSGLEFRRVAGGYHVIVGNLHEGLAEFGFFDDGRLMNEKECSAAKAINWCAQPCAFDKCLTHITVLDDRALVARIAGKDVRFESIVGFKEIQK